MKNLKKTVFLLITSLLFISCHNLLSSFSPASEDNSLYSTVTCRIKNDYDTSSVLKRSIAPITTGKIFCYKVSVTDLDAPDLTFTPCITSEKECSFTVLKEHKIKFSVEAYLVSSENSISEQSVPVMKGENSKKIDASSATSSVLLQFNPEQKTTCKIPLSVKVNNNGNLISCCKVTLKFADKSCEAFCDVTQQQNDSDGTYTLSGSISFNDLSSNFYSVKITLLTGTANAPGEEIFTFYNDLVVYKASDDDNAFTFLINGDENYVEDISHQEIWINHNIYVDSSVAENGKKGTFFDPFKTLNAALNYVNTVSDSKDFVINICTDLNSTEEISINLTNSSSKILIQSRPGDSVHAVDLNAGFCINNGADVTFNNIIFNQNNSANIETKNKSNKITLKGQVFIPLLNSITPDTSIILDSLEDVYITNENKIASTSEGNRPYLINCLYSPSNYTDYTNSETIRFVENSSGEDFFCRVDVKFRTKDDQDQPLSKSVVYFIDTDGKLKENSKNISKLRQKPESDDILLVSTIDDLLALRDFVNNGKYTNAANQNISFDQSSFSFTGITINQTADIDLKSIDNWIPIGNFSKAFSGTYDGKNFKIQNMNITSLNNAYNNCGLFASVENGTIKNCKVNGSISLSSGYPLIGGIVGSLSAGTIDNCVSDVKITNNTQDNSTYTGGIVGQCNDTCIISNCTNLSKITSNGASSTGGIVGKYEAAGTSYVLEIINCKNSGNIINKQNGNDNNIGGIIGESASAPIRLLNCMNTGSLTGSNSSGVAGGILGSITSYSTVKISNCLNTGTVSGFSSNYSILGYNSMAPSCTISNCAILQGETVCNSNINPTDTYSFAISDKNSAINKLNSQVQSYNSSTQKPAVLYKYWTLLNEEFVFTDTNPNSGSSAGGDGDVNVPVPGHIYASSMSQKPTAGSTVYLMSSSDLEKVSEWSQTDSLEDIKFVLDCDVDLTSVNFTPIGNNSSFYFKGSIDGKGYEIKNLSITTSADYALINYGKNTNIKNLKISGNITETATNGYAAGFIVQADGCVIENSINNVLINHSSSKAHVGGFIANCTGDASTINGCFNLADITLNDTESYAGGIIGSVGMSNTNIVKITNTINKGKISYAGTSANNLICLGGIVGGVTSSSGASVQIFNCANKGFIQSNANTTNASDAKKTYCSGILAYESNSNNSNKIINCFNAAKVSGGNVNTAFVSTKNSQAVIEYCYWNNVNNRYGVVEWKNGSSEEVKSEYICVVNMISDYTLSSSLNLIGQDRYALAAVLNDWIGQNTDLYTKWKWSGNQEDGRCQGEPTLPNE